MKALSLLLENVLSKILHKKYDGKQFKNQDYCMATWDTNISQDAAVTPIELHIKTRSTMAKE